MKTYQLSDDRVIVVKKNVVVIKQKDAEKFIEFTPARLATRSILSHTHYHFYYFMFLIRNKKDCQPHFVFVYA